MDILLAMALVPAFVLMWYVYKLDPIEKEPPRLLGRLFLYGALSCLPAIVLESLGGELLLGGRSPYTIPELVLENFVIVAVSEEVCKFFFLYWKTWKHEAFDYVFDGIVYAVFVSLGFAAFENIGYVFEFGMATAVVRAFTAIPGHAIFGVFMGCFYGLAKRAEQSGDGARKWVFLAAAIVVPALGHGFYDFCASIDEGFFGLMFWVFLLLLMVVAMRLVKHMASRAHPVHSGMPQGAGGVPYSSGAALDSAEYRPYIDNSLDGDAHTYTGPNQYGSAAPAPLQAPPSSHASDHNGPFS